MDPHRRRLLALAASGAAAPTLAWRATAQEPRADLARVRAAVSKFAALPGTASCLVAADHPTSAWREAHDPDRRLFVGSAVKTFILAAFLCEVEAGRLSEDRQLPIDDGVRSPVSPVFLNLTGMTEARSVLEAMIAHSDNTATDAALAAVGPDRVRSLIKDAGLTATQIPDSTRRLFSYIAGAPEGVDLGWQAMQRRAESASAGSTRPALNDRETMASTANELVDWYRRVLRSEFFRAPAILLEFKRISAMADSLAHVLPLNTVGFGKGGSIDWDGFHCLCLAGQMVVADVPVTFCFTVNWTGPNEDVPTVFGAYKIAVADVLGEAAATARA